MLYIFAFKHERGALYLATCGIVPGREGVRKACRQQQHSGCNINIRVLEPARWG